MADDSEEKKKDGRMDWICGRLQVALPHLKPEKLMKGLTGKDSIEIVNEFVEGDSPMLLINGDNGIPATELPDRLPKAKWVYILKKNINAELPMKNINEAVMIGEMASDPLQHLELTIREIIIPQISAKVNQGWGEVGKCSL